MKTVYLLRHGKSDWNSGHADHDRILAPRGEDAAHRVGRFLAAIDQVPDRVVSSTAVRACTTAELATQAGHLTAAQAATIARDAGARRLVLGHFSQRYPDTNAFLEEARAVHSDVVVACEPTVEDPEQARVPFPARLVD